MTITYKSRTRPLHSSMPQVSTSQLSRTSSGVPKARAQLYVEIPPSPLHSSSVSAVRALPPGTPMSKGTSSSGNHMERSGNAMGDTLSARKRKLEVFIDIPPSPLHRSTPSSTLQRAELGHFAGVQCSRDASISRSPNDYKGPKSQLSSLRLSGATRSPLSPKIFNSDPRSGPEVPFKKFKHDNLSKASGDDTEKFPNGGSMCHQCHRKVDNLDGVRCTSGQTNKNCKTRYCSRCLKNRYEQDAHVIREQAAPTTLRRVYEEPYIWTCPRCLGNCNCHACRRAKGLAPLGVIVKPKEQGVQATQNKLPITIGATVPCQEIDVPGQSAPNAVPRPVVPAKQVVQPDRPKKIVPEPKWTPVPTSLDRSQAENRFYLREFMLRFSPLMSVAAMHLEDLDQFDSLSDACAKALLVNVLDLIAADAEEEVQKALKEAIKRINSLRLSPGFLWANIALLRKKMPRSVFPIDIPDPSPSLPSSPSPSESRSSEGEALPVPLRKSTRAIKHRKGLTHSEYAPLEIDPNVENATQLIPPLVALCDCALQGASVREEIENGLTDSKEASRKYFAAVREENERWAVQRATFDVAEDKEIDLSDSKSANEVNGKGKKKEKARDPETERQHREALAAHKVLLADLAHAHTLALQRGAPRAALLGVDAQGRVYYAASANWRAGKRIKVPSDDDRAGLTKWGWFLGVWARGDASAEKERGERRWFGFADPAQILQLAKWITAEEGLEAKDGGFGRVHTTGGERYPSRAELKALVKNLIEYASLLSWRISGGAEP